MKKSILALVLAGSLLLTGCSTMLERDAVQISPFRPASSGEASSTLRVETYQKLVEAILYLVNRGEEHGVLTLYNYTQDVEADLTRACLEVVQTDPLGAYAVDYIKHDHSLIVSYYEVNVYISYRRTPEQIASLVSVTGSSAIRREISQTLASFLPEAVLRVSYFNEDEDYIMDLVRQAYYDAPAYALGMPEVDISLYPATGSERIVEISLTYSESIETLRRRRHEVLDLTQSYTLRFATPQSLFSHMRENLVVEEGTGHSSTYDALITRVADSEGIALGYQFLCDQADIKCTLVQGERNGKPHFWNILTYQDGTCRHVDVSAALFNLTDAELNQMGAYEWDRETYPVCVPALSSE